MFAIVLQFANGFANVRQRRVLVFFVETAGHVRPPTSRQFLDAADIDHAVMKIGLQSRHIKRQETPVLPDGIATQRRFTRADMLFDEMQRHGFRFGFANPFPGYAVEQTGGAVVCLVPVVHGIKQRLRLFDGEYRSLGDGIQIAVGDDGGDFDDALLVRVEAGHLQIHPH